MSLRENVGIQVTVYIFLNVLFHSQNDNLPIKVKAGGGTRALFRVELGYLV
jgi:hypothetical protein